MWTQFIIAVVVIILAICLLIFIAVAFLLLVTKLFITNTNNTTVKKDVNKSDSVTNKWSIEDALHKGIIRKIEDTNHE